MTPTDQLATFPLAMCRPAPETEIGRKCGQHFIFFDTTNLTIGFWEILFRQSQEVHTIESTKSDSGYQLHIWVTSRATSFKRRLRDSWALTVTALSWKWIDGLIVSLPDEISPWIPYKILGSSPVMSETKSRGSHLRHHAITDCTSMAWWNEDVSVSERDGRAFSEG